MTTDVSQLKKIAEGREAEMFEWEDGKVLRLYREGEGGGAAHQAALLEIARSCGVRVPQEYGMAEVGGRTGFVMERISGPDLLAEIGAKPWHLPQVGGIWGRVQADLNSRQAPPELEPTRVRFRRLIERSPHIAADLKAAALKQIESLTDGDRLLHGDCHPGNMMRHGEEFVVIDWSNVTRGPAEADFYRSYLMGTLGSLPPGTPWLIRNFARFGRRILRGGFVRSYRRALKLDLALVDAWKLPVIVARIAEGIEAEFPALELIARRLIDDRDAARP